MRDVAKTSPLLHAKALTKNDEPGTFEAIVSVFGNEDSDGEAVAPGAFTESLKGPPPPIVFSHRWGDVPIGKTLDAQELDRAALARLLPDGVPDGVQGALYAKAKLHVDGEYAMERAKGVYRNLLEESLREFSWGGSVVTERIEQRDGRNPLIWLEKVNLVEWGPCLKGANPATVLLSAKAAAVADLEQRYKQALTVNRLSFAPRDTPFDNAEARASVKAWASDGDTADPEKYAKAFLWHDDGEPADKLTAYRFIVADVFNGQLRYVPRAILAAAAVLQGARGGTTIADAGQAEIKRSIEQLYARMRTEFNDPALTVPWSAKSERPEDAQDPPSGGYTGHRLLIAAGCPIPDPPQI